MDLGLAAILAISGVVVTLGIGWGLYEWNSRKANHGRFKTPDEKRDQ